MLIPKESLATSLTDKRLHYRWWSCMSCTNFYTWNIESQDWKGSWRSYNQTSFCRTLEEIEDCLIGENGLQSGSLNSYLLLFPLLSLTAILFISPITTKLIF